jgi:hypothetical protein
VTAVTDARMMRSYSIALAGKIDARESPMVQSGHTVIRKLFILVFVLSVVGNSLAAVLPYIAGDGQCEGNCCQIVRRSDARANQSRLRCLMQCEHPTENQGVPEAPLLRTERDSKVVALVPAGIQAGCSTLNARTPHSSHTAFASTHIYLKISALLI